jgi:uncharacterized protein DUF1549/uncharacterized protein DUF1553/cytochrome c
MRWALILSLTGTLCAQTAQDFEFFEKKIRPIFASKCYGCHGPEAKPVQAHFRIDSREGMLKGGDSGPAIVPGNLQDSRLLKAVSYTDLDLRMPPTGKLSDGEIADLRRWVEMGAPDPRTGTAPAARRTLDLERGKRHWAFRPVVKPSARPEIASGPPASKPVWLRRVTYDLIGLPPTREEMTAYLADTSPDADKNVVERLLASPHYGERWARHWLDLVRFAESNGHEFDNDKLDAWQYRDYVIRAFNDDVPYNQFVREHIAGDLLPEKRLSRDGSFWESPIGTGFYWFGEVLNSAVDSVKSRADQVDNQIDVMGKTFLGLTVACARCHDHKFDPIPTMDYYSLAGYLHSTSMQEAVIDSPARAREIGEAAAKVSRTIDDPPRLILVRPNENYFDGFTNGGPEGWTVQGVPEANEAKEFVGSYTSQKFTLKKLWVHVLLRGTKTDKTLRERAPVRVTLVTDDHKSEHFFPSGKGWEWVTVRMTKEIGRVCYFEIVDRARDGYLQVSTIVLSDNEKPLSYLHGGENTGLEAMQPRVPPSTFAMIAMDESPGDTKVHIRGSHKNLGDIAPRRFLRVIASEEQTPIEPGKSGRLALAEWMASERNPLAARVMVNRIWEHHFGKGIVATPDNFGLTGDRPSNPEMLDWLAARFVESGWSVKAIQREIVLSKAYRSVHVPVQRLEAEAIRDALLSVSGSLDRTMYGRSIGPHISAYQDGRGKPKSGPLDGNNRRSIYIEVRRNFITPMFLAFDYPLPVSTTGARGASTVPSQALMMLNNEFVQLCAERWAKRLESEEQDEAARVRRMFEEAFARPAEDWEVREVAAFARQRGWKESAHTLFNSAEFLYVQ